MKWRWSYLWFLAALPCALFLIMLMSVFIGSIASGDSIDTASLVSVIAVALVGLLLTGLFTYLALHRRNAASRFGLRWTFTSDYTSKEKSYFASAECREGHWKQKSLVATIIIGIITYGPMVLMIVSTGYVNSAGTVQVKDFSHISSQEQQAIVNRYYGIDWSNGAFGDLDLLVRTSQKRSTQADYYSQDELYSLPLDTTVYYWTSSGGYSSYQEHCTFAQYIGKVVEHYDRAKLMRQQNPIIAYMASNSFLALCGITFLVGIFCTVGLAFIQYRIVRRFTLQQEALHANDSNIQLPDT
ncbi:MAG: hypothetical protein ACTILK_02685 [Bifidobacterium crudilactis]|uniref:hypothetical protein n=1 Tax=Bifidobacterium crudilactis TaxID=327277 RepID=UPI003F975873